MNLNDSHIRACGLIMYSLYVSFPFTEKPIFCTICVIYVHFSLRIKDKRNCLRQIDDCCPRLLDYWVKLQHIVSRG